MSFLRTGMLMAAGLVLAWPVTTFAFSFVPTRSEWDAWSPLCKARYSVSSAADGTEFANVVPSATVEQWKAQMGEFVWNNMHHYCAGLAFQFRARLELDPDKRRQFLDRAAKEVDYTYRKLQPGMPLYTTTAVAMGSIAADKGQTKRAVGYLEAAIQAQPQEASAYIALAAVYQRQKRYTQARTTLLAGDEATGGESAEIAYYLGMVSLELGDQAQAVEYARKAYAMGYPLPGLRRRIEAAGLKL
jgi:hypothetical protein